MLIDDKYAEAVIERWYDLRGKMGWYHAPRHVRKVLVWLNDAQARDPRLPDSVEFALEYAALYHDAVYVPGSQDNEKRSAEEALRDAGTLELEDWQRKVVEHLILSTDPERFLGAAQVDMSWLERLPVKPEDWWLAHDRLHDADWWSFHNIAEMKEAEIGLMKEAREAAVTLFGPDCDRQTVALKGRLAFLERILAKEPAIFKTRPEYNEQALLNIRHARDGIEAQLEDL